MNNLKKIILILSITFTSSVAFAAQTQIAQVNGMMCIKCQKMVTEALQAASPNATVKVSWPEGVAVSSFADKSNLTDDNYKEAIVGTGFEVIKVVSVDEIIIDASEARALVEY
jgi:copper chaperone